MRGDRVQAAWASALLILNAKETAQCSGSRSVLSCCEVMSWNLEQDDSGFHAKMRLWVSGVGSAGQSWETRGGCCTHGSLGVQVSLIKTFLQKSSPLVFLSLVFVLYKFCPL